jgi:hypothetical protein
VSFSLLVAHLDEPRHTKKLKHRLRDIRDFKILKKKKTPFGVIPVLPNNLGLIFII